MALGIIFLNFYRSIRQKENKIRRECTENKKKLYISLTRYYCLVLLISFFLISFPACCLNLTYYLSQKYLVAFLENHLPKYNIHEQIQSSEQKTINIDDHIINSPEIIKLKSDIDNLNKRITIAFRDINIYKEDIYNIKTNIIPIFNKFNIKTPINLSLNYNKTEHNLAMEETNIGEILVRSFKFYYEKGSLILNRWHLTNNEEIQGVTNFIQNGINNNSLYRITIAGKASKEYIRNPNNRISNNYELSKARAENIKNIIDDIILRCNAKNINFRVSCVGFSNQENSNPDPVYERYANVLIYEIITK